MSKLEILAASVGEYIAYHDNPDHDPAELEKKFEKVCIELSECENAEVANKFFELLNIKKPRGRGPIFAAIVAGVVAGVVVEGLKEFYNFIKGLI
jgi:hypothetical protein